MARKKNMTVAEMEAERRALDSAIKAAKRAEQKAVEDRLLAERQALGIWLAEEVGAKDLEAVKALRAALGSDELKHLEEQVALAREEVSTSTAHGAEMDDSSDSSAHGIEAQASGSSDTDEAHSASHGAGSSDDYAQ